MSIETFLFVEGILEELSDYQRYSSTEHFDEAFILLLDSAVLSFFFGHDAAEVEHADTGKKVSLCLTEL